MFDPSLRARHVVASLVGTMLLAGCAGPAITGTTEGDFRHLDARLTKTFVEYLTIKVELTNTGTTAMTGGGCQIPSMVIDVQTSDGWLPLGAEQSGELVACIRSWSLAPGATTQFETSFKRTSSPTGPVEFPRNTPLRLRVQLSTQRNEPVLPITLR